MNEIFFKATGNPLIDTVTVPRTGGPIKIFPFYLCSSGNCKTEFLITFFHVDTGHQAKRERVDLRSIGKDININLTDILTLNF